MAVHENTLIVGEDWETFQTAIHKCKGIMKQRFRDSYDRPITSVHGEGCCLTMASYMNLLPQKTVFPSLTMPSQTLT